MSNLLQFPRVLHASRIERGQLERAPLPRFCCDELAGRLVELSSVGGTASLTAALGLVLEAQRRSDPVVWITAGRSTFFPPDAAEGGVDLEALPVVRVSDTGKAARAADLLARSGAFGLVVVDLGPEESLPLSVQSRLAGLALKYDVCLVFLTRKARKKSSLGSMISLRGAAFRGRAAKGLFECRIDILKDKRRGPGWKHSEVCRPHPGLR